MTKSSSAAGSVTIGDQITYTLYAYNAGPSTSSNVVVRDAIPTGTVYISASGGACTFYPNFQRVDCDVGNLAPFSSVYVYVTVQVTNTGSIVNFANANGTTPDPNTTNNASGVTNMSITASADVSMTKYSSAGGAVNVGDQITYTLYAYNYGPSTSSNVIVRDAIPTGTVYISASGGACTFYPNFQRVDCDVGDLAPFNSAYVYVTVQVTNADKSSTSPTPTGPRPIRIRTTTPARDEHGDGGEFRFANHQDGEHELHSCRAERSVHAHVAKQRAERCHESNHGDRIHPVVLPVCERQQRGDGRFVQFGPGTVDDSQRPGFRFTRVLNITVTATNFGSCTNTATVNVPGGVNDPNLANNTSGRA